MSGNTIGKLFCVTTFGESHGVAYGCIIDGCPPGMELNESDIQQELIGVNRRDHGILRNDMRQIKSKFYLVFLKAVPPGHRSDC